MKSLFFVVAIVFSFAVNAQEARPETLIEKAEKYINAYPDSAFIFAKQAKFKYKFEADKHMYAKSLQIIGNVFYNQGLFSEALEHLFEAEQIFNSLQDYQAIGENINLQALIYYKNKQPDLALEHHLEALEIYKHLNDSAGLAYTLGCIGRQHEKRSDYKVALEHQNLAKEIYQEIGDSSGLAVILENIASIYEDLEQFDQAEWYFTKSLEFAKNANDSLLMIINLNNLGDIGRKTGNLTQALEYGNEALKLSERLNDLYQQNAAHRDLAKVYEAAENFERAFFHLNSSKILYNEMYTNETLRQVTLLQAMFEMEQKNSDIQLLENQGRIDRLIRRLLYGGLFILIAIAVFIFRNQRKQMRRNQEASKVQNALLQANNELMQQKLNNQMLEENRLQQELEIKSKNLTAHTLHLIGKNKILDEVKEQLTNVINKDKRNLSQRLSKLIKQIEINIYQDKDWEDFSTIFQSVHQNFFDKIHEINADLSPAEVRLAALIRLNLPSKDMATLLGISSDSLRIARYRLKKKLKLNADTSLSHFLLAL